MIMIILVKKIYPPPPLKIRVYAIGPTSVQVVSNNIYKKRVYIFLDGFLFIYLINNCNVICIPIAVNLAL